MFVNKYFIYSFTEISTESVRFIGPDGNHIASFVEFTHSPTEKKVKLNLSFYLAPAPSELNKFNNLIGSWGGRNFLLRTTTVSESVGLINLSPLLRVNRRFITASYLFLRS